MALFGRRKLDTHEAVGTNGPLSRDDPFVAGEGIEPVGVGRHTGLLSIGHGGLSGAAGHIPVEVIALPALLHNGGGIHPHGLALGELDADRHLLALVFAGIFGVILLRGVIDGLAAGRLDDRVGRVKPGIGGCDLGIGDLEQVARPGAHQHGPEDPVTVGGGCAGITGGHIAHFAVAIQAPAVDVTVP